MTGDSKDLPDEAKPFKWEKGQSGNPSGRPKGAKNRKTLVREMLNSIDPETGLTEVEKMIAALMRRAKQGDVQAFNSLMDSGFGKVKEEISTTHNFKRMDSIGVELDGEEAKALTFDVGSPIKERDDDT